MNATEFQTFTQTKENMTLKARWGKKDFGVFYDWNGIILHWGLHIMYMCPKVYCEEDIKNFCQESFECFKEAVDILEARNDFFKAKQKEYEKEYAERTAAIEEINKKKRELKRQFKQGQIEEREFQKKTYPLNKEKQRLNYHDCTDYGEQIESLQLNCNEITKKIMQNYLEDLWDEPVKGK